MKNYQWYAGSGRSLALTLTEDQADSCSHAGPCDADIDSVLPELEDQTSRWGAGELAAELKEYGAWTKAELSDHEENIKRMVWIACGDCKNEPDIYQEN